MPRRKQDRPQRMKWDECEQEKQSLTSTEVAPQIDDSEARTDTSSPNTPQTTTEETCPTQEKATLELMNYSPVSSLSLESPSPPITSKIRSVKEDSPGDVAVNLTDTPLDFSIKKNACKHKESLQNGVIITEDGPLDLSIPRRRKETELGAISAKISKLEHPPKSPWGYCAPRTLTPPTGSSKTRSEEWNGRVKTRQDSKEHHKKNWLDKNGKGLLAKNDSHSKSFRQNPWQSQWISRSSDQTKDVFTCVWCKESFKSLSEMTIHMKQSSRCGVAGMQTPPSTSQAPPPNTAPSTVTTTSSSDSIVKETVSLPRKLVRGQDVWLGKGAEQTRQILKCMWCGQSFKSLADMTTHMRVTQHYTNIISQEQIISWRTPEDKMASQSHVNAVLTCKVCDQAFGSLKELSYHMVKNSHYKEHILRSITDGGGRRRQSRERRKKSLPVRKLLELERLEISRQNQGNTSGSELALKNEVVDGKITCEECTERVDAKDFVQHIKRCGQGSVKTQQDSVAENQVTETSDGPSESPKTNSPPIDGATSESPGIDAAGGGKCQEEPKEQNDSTSVLNAIERLIEKSFEPKGRRVSASTGILQRLGIDEELCPPWQPSMSPNVFYKSSDVIAKSPSGGNLTPATSYEEQPLYSNLSPRSSSSSGVDQAPGSFRDMLSRTSSPALNACNSDTETECIEQQNVEASGEHSVGSTSDIPVMERNGTDSRTPPMDENSRVSTSNKMPSSSPNENKDETEKRSNMSVDHPLKELQKLLDKTDTHMSRSNIPPAPPGSILAFSWACTESNSNDSLLKCAFCDTHFVSKGAYRHHLSKTHFIKDNNTPDPNWTGSKSEETNNTVPKDSPSSEESPHSKFLKYTELAKQLSSKYV
ncbi:protein tiptop-like isoform X1 [Centruroides sculpturatus]|uniref:protein tiptop-like isoform X1 n=2 Tax=Centruroides sculpturatus TaxID=218467 RepID=UPI000C6DCABF|nr:protein tiptop-like isoform X1 [Centruroides sculpturatus]